MQLHQPLRSGLHCANLERAQPELPLLNPPPLTDHHSPLPEQIELYRDRMWRRDEDLPIESGVDAEPLTKTWALQIL